MNMKLSRRDFIKFTAAGSGALALGAIGINRLLSEPELKAYEETQLLLGTFVTIKAVDIDEKNARSMVKTTFDEINRLSNVFNRFDPGSELSSLNKSGQIYGASSDLVSIIKSSIQYSELTGGLFDITTMPLLELNQESFNANNAPPSSESVAEAKSVVGYQNIDINGNDVTLSKTGTLVHAGQYSGRLYS